MDIIIATIVAAIVGGLAGSLATYFLQQRNQIRGYKFDTLRRVCENIGSEYTISKDALNILDGIPVAFSDSRKVLAALNELYRAINNAATYASTFEEDAYYCLLKEMFLDLGIKHYPERCK